MISATTKRMMSFIFVFLFLLTFFLTTVPNADASTGVSDVPDFSGCTAEEAAQILENSSFHALREKFVSIENLPSDKIPHFANK